MFPNLICDFVLENLATELEERRTPMFDPLRVDSWIARSVMQKAIRRGMGDLACRAAAQLLLIDQRTLWRRLLITAMEDLGPAEINTTARIVAAWRNRSWRSHVGGDWPVISELVRRSAEAPKCQSANDLWNVARNDPALDDFKADICESGDADILAAATTPVGDVGRRAVATLLALRSDVGCAPSRQTSPTPVELFDAFETIGQFSQVTAICREAFQLTNVPLAGLMLCLWPEQCDVQSVAKDDWVGPVHWSGEVPTFALDQYTRSGKAAIRRYVSQSIEWKSFCDEALIPAGLREAAAGEILFRVDGSALAKRRLNSFSTSLNNQSRVLGAFMDTNKVYEAMTILRRQLPLIEKIRSSSIPIFPKA